MTEDERFMRRALRLTTRTRPHPSPCVGAVVVRDGVIVSEGWTYATPKVHAEAMALAIAGERASGATLYTTLEPCSHWARPDGTTRVPCTEYIRQARIARVVCAIRDPNPQVDGDGFRQIQDAAIDLEIGVETERAERAHRAFLKHQTTGLPFILHKAAMTLDGKIAASRDQPTAITGPEARRRVHQLRHACDAVIVGVGTVLSDDPLLTTRLSGRVGHDPVRVVIDSQLRTPITAKIARKGTVVLTTDLAPNDHEEALVSHDVEVVRLPMTSENRVDLLIAARWIAERGWLECLLESGGTLAQGFYAAGLIDRVLYFVAPKLLGGGTAPTPIDGGSFLGSLRLGRLTVRRFGDDLGIEAAVLPY